MTRLEEMIEVRDSRRKHYFTVDDEVFDMGLNVYTLAVYFYLCRCAGDKAFAFPSLKNLQKTLSISKDRLLKSLKELEEKNMIRRERRVSEKGNYQSTVYILLDKSVWKRESDSKAESNDSSKEAGHEAKGGWSSDGQGVGRQTDKGWSPDDQGVGRETTKGWSPDDHKEKTIKKTNIEEKTKEEKERDNIYTSLSKEFCLKTEEKEKKLLKEERLNYVNNLHKSGACGTDQVYLSPHARQIVDIFKRSFMRKFGIPPTITSKALRELSAILSRLSLTERAAFVEKIKGAVERYLSSDELFVKRSGYSFQVFVSTIQKYMLNGVEVKAGDDEEEIEL
jgi:predicted transcriptional regulator